MTHVREYNYVKFEKKGKLVWITINRPEVLNALHPPANEELDHAFDVFQNDPDLWVAIITGAGEKAFCVGNDLKFQAKEGGGKVVMPKGGFGGITRRFDCFKPVIAAVNGIALGGGFEIVLASDIVISAQHGFFGLPEPRVGMIPRTGLHRLIRQIPYHLAKSIILTGRKISAVEAQTVGIVSEVVPLGKLKSAAEEWAEEILQCSPLAIRACKQAIQMGLKQNLEAALGLTYPLEEIMKESEDYQEGPRAFVEKRKPQWKGF